ncbi:anaphase-promoting complex subunit 1-like, partial [Capsicum annuum]|uniref:anaphase-promoting complex subunit 1-like n=1 Tax=Capsicum annuum TaxID=4072 RepID=UPI001FB0A31C
VRRLLCSARPVVIQTPVNPTASDQDLQQAQLWQLAQRTTALPFGRGAFTLSTTCTLLTEALTVPKLILAGRLPSQQNATVSLDPNVRNIQELKSWPEFHNAVAAGLRLAPPQGKMSRTWILYNKPEEPTVVHAGLLLALGLRGHLRVLTITDIYQYYSQVVYSFEDRSCFTQVLSPPDHNYDFLFFFRFNTFYSSFFYLYCICHVKYNSPCSYGKKEKNVLLLSY